MIPSPAGARRTSTAAAARYKYFRRLLHFRQMDFEIALSQMVHLVTRPAHVYRTASYQKTHKNQYARDDPAFVVLLAAFLCVSSVMVSVVFGLSFFEFIAFLLWVVFVDCIGSGCVLATIGWWVSNKFLREKQTFTVSEKVEWAFAFDVHCNAFFPLLLILHVVQLFLIGIVNHENFLSTLLGNTLWLVALCYYFYITFLGYAALPFLNKTTVVLFLCPIVLVFGTYVVALMLNWNISRSVFKYYGLQED